MAVKEQITTPITRYTEWSSLPQLLSAHELAAYLNCSVWTIYTQINDGTLPVLKYGKRKYIPREAVHPRVAEKQVTA